jgi:hypothetical protein
MTILQEEGEKLSMTMRKVCRIENVFALNIAG